MSRKANEIINVTENRRPKILLMGNGPLICYGGSDWKKFLKGFNNRKFKIENYDELPLSFMPFPLSSAEIADAMKNNKESLFETDRMYCQNKIITDLLGLDFDLILTTNYTYEIEENIVGHSLKEKEIKNMMTTFNNKRAEGKFNLHTFNRVASDNKKYDVFHIHGEARKPSSIVIDLFMYGKLLSKYYQALYGVKYANPITPESWLDYFVLGDVYVLGFGYDFSETDMWWLLKRKYEEKNPLKGKVFFYDPIEPDAGDCIYLPEGSVCKYQKKNDIVKSQKLKLMQKLGVTVIQKQLSSKSNDGYKQFYSDCIDDLRNRL